MLCGCDHLSVVSLVNHRQGDYKMSESESEKATFLGPGYGAPADTK